MAQSRSQHKIGFYAFLCGFAALGAIIISSLAGQFIQWRKLGPDVLIAGNSWHVGKVAEEGIPKSLWSKGEMRPQQVLRSPFDVINLKSFWLGTSVPTDSLRNAANLDAQYLGLGWVNGGYDLWLNGELVQSSEVTGEPIFVNIREYLKGNSSLSIALRIKNPDGRVRADNFSYFYGRELGEGFFTKKSMLMYEALQNFSRSQKPIALCLANFLVALFFFSLWATAPLKREIFYLATYTFIGGALQLLGVDSVYNQIPVSFAAWLNTALVFCECVSGLMLGMTFARKNRWLPQLWYFLAAGPILALPFFHAISSQYLLGRAFNNWFNPACYFLGALVCFLEFKQLKVQLPQRAQRLLGFAIGLFLISSTNLLQGLFWKQLPFLENVLLFRFLNFSLVLYLASIELKEYRLERKILQQTPISPYHRRSILPERVNGVMLMIDLKNSESIFSLESEENGIIEACISHIWSSVMEFGGVVLQTEGDSLRAFFDEKNCKNSADMAAQAAAKVCHELKLFEEQIRERDISPSKILLRFRASLVSGAIKPVWQGVGETRYAAWSDAQGGNCFVESARLLEIEKSLDLPAEETRILVSDLVVAKLVNSPLSLVTANQSRVGKHGKIYHFSVFSPQEENTAVMLSLVA